MSQTKIDLLFPPSAAGAARTPAAGKRASDPLSAFGDHLTVASGSPAQVAGKPADASSGRRPFPASGGDSYSTHANQPQTAPSAPAPTGTDSQPLTREKPADEPKAADSTHESDEAGQPSADREPADDAAEATELPAALAVVTNTVDAATSTDEVAAVDETEVAGESPTPENRPDGQSDEPSPAAVKSAEKHSAEGAALESTASGEAAIELNAEPLDEPTATPTADEDAEESKGVAVDKTIRARKSTATHDSPVAAGDDLPTANAEQNESADAQPNEQAAPVAAREKPISKDTDKRRGDDSEREAGRRLAQKTVKSDTPLAAVADADTQLSGAPAPVEASHDAAPKPIHAHAKADAMTNLLERAQPGSAAAARSRAASGEEDMPRVDPARFIGRVSKAFQTAQERGGTLQLRLAPPDLGSLRLELTVKEGVMTAALETETTAARRLLLDHLPALRDRLAEQNIRVERFDVDVRRDGAGGQADERAAHHQRRQHDQPAEQRGQRQAVPSPPTIESASREAATLPSSLHDTQINLMV